MLLVLTLFRSTLQAIDFQFSQPVKSNQKSYKETYAGPLPGYFAQCVSATECAVYQNQTLVWSNNKLSQASAYSCQFTRKVLITGQASKILDFNKFSKDIGTPAGKLKPKDRAANPPKIQKCQFTKGIKWIC